MRPVETNAFETFTDPTSHICPVWDRLLCASIEINRSNAPNGPISMLVFTNTFFYRRAIFPPTQNRVRVDSAERNVLGMKRPIALGSNCPQLSSSNQEPILLVRDPPAQLIFDLMKERDGGGD
jgi:hypothetical protein